MARTCRVRGFFPPLAWKTNFADRQTGVPERKWTKEKMGGVEELTPWTGRVCYALFYVCIALNNLWFPSK